MLLMWTWHADCDGFTKAASQPGAGRGRRPRGGRAPSRARGGAGLTQSEGRRPRTDTLGALASSPGTPAWPRSPPCLPGAALLTLTVGGAISTRVFKSQHQTDTCVWRSHCTLLGGPTPCSKAAGKGVGAAWGVCGGRQRAPSHSEKWEEATASRNTAPRPLGSG